MDCRRVRMAQEGEPGQGQVAPVEQENALMWIVKTSGLIGGVLLVLSIYFVSTVCRMFVELRPIVVAPPEIVSECQEMLQKRQFKEIYNVVKDDQSFYQPRAVDRHCRTSQRTGRSPRSDGTRRRSR